MEPPGEKEDGLGARVAAALFASVLVFLLAHAAPPGIGGERHMALARAIVHQRTVLLEERGGDPAPRIGWNDELIVRGKLVLNTNPGYAFLLVPGEVVAAALHVPPGNKLEMLIALAFFPLPLAALGVVALADLGARLTRRRSAGLLAAGLFLLGTPELNLACCLNQNAALVPLLIIALWLVLLPGERPGARAALAGAVLGFAFVTDLSALALTGLLGVFLLTTERRRDALLLGAVLVPVALLILPYDLAAFGTLRPPNSVFAEAWARSGSMGGGAPAGPDLLTGAGILYTIGSWRGGLLAYCPFVLPAVVHGVRAARGEDERFAKVAILALSAIGVAFAYACVNASWQHFEILGNAIYGPRYQLWAMPLAALLFAQPLARSCGAWACAGFSVVVCTTGAMYPPPNPDGYWWFFYQGPALFLTLGPRAPLMSTIVSSRPWVGRVTKWYCYEIGEAPGTGLSLVVLALLLAWVAYARRERAREEAGTSSA